MARRRRRKRGLRKSAKRSRFTLPQPSLVAAPLTRTVRSTRDPRIRGEIFFFFNNDSNDGEIDGVHG